jgi:GNAT superfamily N-acetyltransferase
MRGLEGRDLGQARIWQPVRKPWDRHLFLLRVGTDTVPDTPAALLSTRTMCVRISYYARRLASMHIRCGAQERLLLMQRSVTTTYLEMTDRAHFRPAHTASVDFQLTRVEVPCPELNRFLFAAVGADWWWYSRLDWDYARWLAYLDRQDLETWVAYCRGTPAGYFELERQEDGNVELVYFGLMPAFIGKGIGGPLLSAAIARAWEMGAARVWVHTCTLDHPQACRNYETRGFTIYKAEQKIEDLPDQALEPWPGAKRRSHPES